MFISTQTMQFFDILFSWIWRSEVCTQKKKNTKEKKHNTKKNRDKILNEYDLLDK